MSPYKFEPNHLEQLTESGPPAGSCGEIVAGLFKPARGFVWFLSDKKTFLVFHKSLKQINGGKK